MKKNILAAIDGSPASAKALREAIALAGQLHVRLTLLCVVDFYAAINVMQMANEQLFEHHLAAMRQRARGVLDAACAQASAAGVQAVAILSQDDARTVADAILAESEKGYDLLVMGTHGRRGLDRLLTGSDAEQVLRRAAIPVLLVR